MSCDLNCRICTGGGEADHTGECCRGTACGNRTMYWPPEPPVQTIATGGSTYASGGYVNIDFTTYPGEYTTIVNGTPMYPYTTTTVQQFGTEEPIRTIISAPPTRDRDADQRTYLAAQEADRDRSRARRDALLEMLRTREEARATQEAPAPARGYVTSAEYVRAADPEAPKLDAEAIATKKIAELMKQNELEVEVKPQKEATPRERQAEF